MIYNQGWEAKNINQLKRRIMQKIRKIDINLVQTMFLHIKKQLRKIVDKGPFHACSS